jgi:hypothetical protein
MKTSNTSRKTSDRRDSRFVAATPRKSEPRSAFMRLPQHQRSIPNALMLPTWRGEMAEILTDMDGVSVLVRFRLNERSAEARPTNGSSVRNQADFRLRLTGALEKIVDLMRGSFPQGDAAQTRPPFAKIGPISSGEPLGQLRARPNDTVLRVGLLDLDLIDRTAKRLRAMRVLR